MKKKLLSVLLCVVLIASFLVGCGSTNETEETDATDETEKTGISDTGTTEMEVEGENVTELTVWTFIALHQEFYTSMADKWNEQHPDKMVKLVLSNLAYDDMHNKLSLALESGEGAPDIVDIELGKFPAFLAGEIGLLDLTEYVAPYKDSVVKARLDIYSKDSINYGYPTHVGATVAFYNDEILQAAGINYADIKTWDDFKAAGVKYFEATGKYFATVETTAQWMINLMLAQKNGNYLDADGKLAVNSDLMVEVLSYIKGMQDTGAFGIIPGGQPDSEEAYAAFNSGDYAVQIMPFWQTSRFVNYMTDLSGKVKIAPTPVWNTTDGEYQSIGGGGTGTAIVATSPNAALAAEVMAFIKLSEEANKEVWNVLGFDPVNTSVWSDTALTQNPDNQYVKYFANYPFDALLSIKDNIGALACLTDEKWPSVNNEFCTVTLNSIFENGMDVKEALDASQATLENEFQ
jgi:arabinosaccharide transport system substrate-binding protein